MVTLLKIVDNWLTCRYGGCVGESVRAKEGLLLLGAELL